ncbi:hypothetical protein D6D18_10321 [Aureobasidium pullulans]|nr:hypothetical protein D6D18_10321 [Aureobasidium pullulans]
MDVSSTASYRTNSRLLDFPALDALDQYGQTKHDFEHRTASIVCGIIANNAWNGYLTRTRAGARTMLDDELVFMEADHHDTMWTQGSKSKRKISSKSSEDKKAEKMDKTNTDTLSCPRSSTGAFPTAACHPIERTHLCPRSEVEWFLDQDMDRYNNSRSLMGNNVVDDLSNSLALRADIYQSFDAGNFVFVPKQDRWVAHFIVNTRTLRATYHNTIVDLDPVVHPCFLLTRLAWAVLPMVANFLLRGHVRCVTIKQPQATSSTP